MAPSHINRVLSVGPQALGLQQNTLNKMHLGDEKPMFSV